jgi:hypothetical protein
MRPVPVLLTVTLLGIPLYVRFVLYYTVLRRIDLEILATAERGDVISDLTAKLDHSELSCAAADLAD